MPSGNQAALLCRDSTVIVSLGPASVGSQRHSQTPSAKNSGVSAENIYQWVKERRFSLRKSPCMLAEENKKGDFCNVCF